jgi:hypothetical protein
MTRLVERFVGGLPLDSRARRAVDETLLDWRHEAGDAQSRLGRAARNFAGLAAIARVVARAVAVETVHVPVLWFLPRLAVCAGVPAALLLASSLSFAWALATPLRNQVELVATLFVGRVLTFLPLALFLAVASSPSRRKIPRLGLAAGSFVFVLTVGWIQIVTSGHFSDLMRDLMRGTASLHPVAFVDLGWREVAWRLVVPERVPPIVALVFIAGMAAATSALVLLAGALQVVSGWRRWIWIAGVPAALLMLVGSMRTAEFVFGRWKFLPLAALSPWVAAVVALGAAFRIGREALGTRTAHPAPRTSH